MVWRVEKLEDISLEFIGGGTPSTSKTEYWNGDIPWMTSAHIDKREISAGQKYITGRGLKDSAANVVPKNNLIIATRVGIGKVAINKIDIAISQDLTGVVIKKDKAIPDFLFWVIINNAEKLKLLAQGSTIKGILKEDLRKIKLPLPSLPEQKKIAEILSTVDQAIEKVDEAIEKTQRVKKGLMQELLTKGIGHREFKNSEIGEIPKEWRLMKIHEIADVKGGKRIPKGHKLVEHKTPHPYIRVLDFKNMSVDKSNIQYLNPETFSLIKKYTISSEDLYISIAGTVGLTGMISRELNGANLTENAAKLCNLRKVEKEFLAYVLNSYIGQNQIFSFVGKAQQPKLALFRIEKIKIPIPPLSEQQRIAETLSTVDNRMELSRRRKDKLQRLKRGLMNDLLTGKKRVKLEA